MMCAFARIALIAALGGPSLAACNHNDWWAQTVADAEARMRENISDPSAQFSRVQVTGDDKTGQTCGFISAKFAADGLNHTARFIVYIDNTAGPFVDGQLGRQPLTQDAFAQAWQADCVNEGYVA